VSVLEYDIRVIGARQLDAVFAGIERRAAQHNATMMRTAGGGRGGPYRTPGAVPSRAAARTETFAQIREEQAARLRAVRSLAAQKRQTLVSEHRRELRRIEERAAAELRATKQANAARAMSQRNMRGAVGRAALGSTVAVGRTAATVAGIGGAAIVGAGVMKQVNVEKQAAMLANKAFGTTGEMRSREQIRSSLLEQSAQLGARTGDRAGIISAIDKFVAISGSLKGGQHQAQFMADIADATGASMVDVGRTAGQIMQNIVATKGRDVSDPEQFRQTMEEVQSVMAAMAGHAKIGSIEFADLATQMGKVMSATSRFSGTADDLANQMGAISQLAIAGGAASPQEAMTSIMRFSDDLIQNAKRFDKLAKGAGVGQSFFTDEGKTKLRDPTSIMMDILRVTKGDLTKTKKIFGIRAMKAVEPFQQAYVSARETGMTEEQALENVRTTIGRFKGAKMTSFEVEQSAQFTRAQTGRQLQIAWEDLTTTVGQELTPALVELTQALIGQAVTNALTAQIASSNAANALGGVAGSARTATAAFSPMVASVTALGAALAAIGMVANETATGIKAGDEAATGRTIGGYNAIEAAKRTLLSGKELTTEQEKALQGQLSAITSAESERDRVIAESSTFGGNIMHAWQGAKAAVGFGAEYQQTVSALQGAPTQDDVENRAQIETLLSLNESAQKTNDAAQIQRDAATELSIAAKAIQAAAEGAPTLNRSTKTSFDWLFGL
jgi:hypothetical protein